MTNINLAERVLRSLLASGVKEFCLCAGARNSPFVRLLDFNPHLKVYHFFEERSAAFFAIGRIAATRRPVAVITTSGTAVAECLPAAVEGTHSSLPLILVTADRPKHYRGTGAPQTIEQVGMFSYYIEASFDLDKENTHISLNGLSWKKPVHLNVCFQEPLLDDEMRTIPLPEKINRQKFPEAFPMQMINELDQFLSQTKPVVILSTLPEKCKTSVLDFLKRLKAPIYAEAISGLRGHPELLNLQIRSGDKIIAKLIDDGYCTSVLRLGGIPTLRFWRDLEDRRATIPVFSLGYNHFVGLSREAIHFDDLEDLNHIEVVEQTSYTQKLQDLDTAQRKKMTDLFEKYPLSEPSLMRSLSTHTHGQSVYLGNSLPIREWDLASEFSKPPERVAGNRGANGIDGQISTFLGWAKPKTENWCIVGDLTALYDLASLWISNQIETGPLRIVIMNNHGGMIFKRMFEKDIFLNRHQLSFDHWAQMWNWSYIKTHEPLASSTALADRQIIEMIPDEKQTELFWQELEKIWTP